MSDDPPPLTDPATSAAHERSLVEEVRHVFEDGKTYLEAELQFQKSRAALAGSGAAKAVALGALAVALLLLVLLAIIVGLLLALAESVGPWGAMGLVVLALLCGTAISGWLARSAWRGAMGHFKGSDTPKASSDV